MIEKDTGYQKFQKKIVPYLDGSLSSSEASEFEAFVHTHPDFKTQIKLKEEEIQLIRNMLPIAIISRDSAEYLENEMRSSIFNLLKEEPKNIFDTFRIKWEEWISR
jgi:hypothetical protein